MSLFKKAVTTPAHLKASFYGELGTGKTFTASHLAIGLVNLLEKSLGKKPPVYFFDTENGSGWVEPFFRAAGIDFYVVKGRAFSLLMQALSEAEAANAVLIIDSISHVWEEVQTAYLAAKRTRKRDPNARLEISDWNVIKREWAKFTAAFVNSKMHVILCGRAASIFEMQEKDDDSGRKEMIAVGTKMAAEKGLGYEPNLVVEMSATEKKLPGGRKEVIYLAFIKKDRSTFINGRYFTNPSFNDFRPHVDFLNLGGTDSGIDLESNSEKLFAHKQTDDRSAQREIVLSEIGQLFTIHMPGRSAEEQKRKQLLLKKHFNAAWGEIEARMSLEDLRNGYDSLHRELENKPSRYACASMLATPLDDAVPDFEVHESLRAPRAGRAAPPPQNAGVEVSSPAAGRVSGQTDVDSAAGEDEDADTLDAAFKHGERDGSNRRLAGKPPVVPKEYVGHYQLTEAYKLGFVKSAGALLKAVREERV